jgi:hypothetical protein
MPLLPVDVGGYQTFVFPCNGGIPERLSAFRVVPVFTLPIFPADKTLRVCSNTPVLNINIMKPEVYVHIVYINIRFLPHREPSSPPLQETNPLIIFKKIIAVYLVC